LYDLQNVPGNGRGFHILEGHATLFDEGEVPATAQDVVKEAILDSLGSTISSAKHSITFGCMMNVKILENTKQIFFY